VIAYYCGALVCWRFPYRASSHEMPQDNKAKKKTHWGGRGGGRTRDPRMDWTVCGERVNGTRELRNQYTRLARSGHSRNNLPGPHPTTSITSHHHPPSNRFATAIEYIRDGAEMQMQMTQNMCLRSLRLPRTADAWVRVFEMRPKFRPY
jgi:hypothetical protein